MLDVTSLSPERLCSVTALARFPVAAARTRTLHPAEDPAVPRAVERLGRAGVDPLAYL